MILKLKQTPGIYLAVRYAECSTRPVRVPAGGCGCDLSECEYSRVRDGYAVRVLTQLPSSYANLRPGPRAEGFFSCPDVPQQCAGACPPCPAEPWVILADITLKDGKVYFIDCFAHRRFCARLIFRRAAADILRRLRGWLSIVAAGSVDMSILVRRFPVAKSGKLLMSAAISDFSSS